MDRQLETDVKEIRDRVIRMESRVVQLGDHVGANLRTKLRIMPKTKGSGERYVEVDSYDVSISRIMTELQSLGWTGDLPVEVGGVVIATLHMP